MIDSVMVNINMLTTDNSLVIYQPKHFAFVMWLKEQKAIVDMQYYN